MKISGYRRSAVPLLCCILTFVAFSFPAVGAPAPAEPKPSPEDPLGRSTPYGTVIGFLQAANKTEYEVAANYLEGKQSARRKAELARSLHVVLNRGLKIGPDDLSKAPAGSLTDGLAADLEKVGTATFGSESLDIVLRLTKTADTPAIWLFSAETLLGVTAAASQLDLPWAEAIWPESFRDIRFLSYPLFTWLNVLVGIPLLVGIAWPLTRGLLRLLHPLDLRHSGGNMLAQIKWLLFLLIFSLLARLVATQAATAEGRIFVTSVANVFIIVAAGWILVRLTKFVARLKTQHLRQIGLPGKIATVELSNWLLVCVWFTAGLFLILRSLGVELTAVIAGLGIGGIAFAFAAQKTIENLFGTVTVVADEAIQVGDPVIGKYYEALVVEVKKAGEGTPGVSTQQAVARSKPGEVPAGAVGQQITVTATIEAIDKKARTVTIKGPEGNSVTVKARDPKNLDKVKVGDNVEITYTEALVISLDKPAKK